jgi:acyl-CoA synthetase (AMP-forming)/AMP-acid ligase II
MSGPQSLVEALRLAAGFSDVELRFQTHPGDYETYLYRDLLGRARRVAASLQAKGIKPGDRVALILPTSVSFYDAFFGVLFAGAVPCALYPPVRLGRLQEWKKSTAAMLRRLPAAAVLTDGRLLGLVGHPTAAAGVPLLALRVNDLLGTKALQLDPIPQSDDLACVQFSSGSTGEPKPVALSHYNMIANAQAIMNTFPGDPRAHSGVSWLPLYHDMGLVGALVVALITPATLTLLPPERFIARPRLWLEALSESGATVSVAPNFAYGLCADRVENLEGLDLSRWKVALCGAEPVHPTTLQRFIERFAEVGFPAPALTPVYGLAEATLAVTFSSYDKPFDRLRGNRKITEESRCFSPDESADDEWVSVGKPLAGHAVQIRRQDEPVEEGQIGGIWVSGPGVMKGYLDDPEATAAVIQDGWLDTGDEGFIWKQELYLTGRSKDLIILRGRNYDPAAIEQSLIDLEGLRAGCVAAFSVEAKESEGLVLLAEAHGQPSEQLLDAIRNVLRARVGMDPVAIEVLPAGSLPRTSSGKIRRSLARQLWLENRLTKPNQPGVLRLLAESFQGHRKLLQRRL